MEVLNLIKLFWGWVFPDIGRIHTAYICEDSSILGTSLYEGWTAWAGPPVPVWFSRRSWCWTTPRPELFLVHKAGGEWKSVKSKPKKRKANVSEAPFFRGNLWVLRSVSSTWVVIYIYIFQACCGANLLPGPIVHGVKVYYTSGCPPVPNEGLYGSPTENIIYSTIKAEKWLLLGREDNANTNFTFIWHEKKHTCFFNNHFS